MSIHIQACVWFALACDNVSYKKATECRQGSWANNPDKISLGKLAIDVVELKQIFVFFLDINLAVSTSFEKYIMALYWAVATTTSTG